MLFQYSVKAAISSVLLLASISAIDAFPLAKRAAPQSPSFASLPKPILAPYYLYFGNMQVTLSDAFDSLGMNAATVGFLSAPEGNCSLTTDLDAIKSDVLAFIGKGGAISMSFGGNLQDPTVPRQHVQQACSDANSLAQLIQSAMNEFQTNNLEFDIEDHNLLVDKASASRLGNALAMIKKAKPDTYITYTLGTSPMGMPSAQVDYIKAAQQSGVTIDTLTLMTMDMGGTDNVADAQTAITSGAQQLATVYNLQASDAMQKMGMLPAIGVDDNGVVIDLAGATTLGQFAQTNQLAVQSLWSFNRDFPGGSGSPAQLLNESSSPDQTEPSQFFTTFQAALKSGSAGSGTANVSSIANTTVAPTGIPQPGQKPPSPPAGAQGLAGPGTANAGGSASAANAVATPAGVPQSGQTPPSPAGAQSVAGPGTANAGSSASPANAAAPAGISQPGQKSPSPPAGAQGVLSGK